MTTHSKRQIEIDDRAVVLRSGSDFARYVDVVDIEDFGVGLMLQVEFVDGRRYWYFEDELRPVANRGLAST